MADEKKKVDIEDIKDPNEELDIEDAVLEDVAAEESEEDDSEENEESPQKEKKEEVAEPEEQDVLEKVVAESKEDSEDEEIEAKESKKPKTKLKHKKVKRSSSNPKSWVKILVAIAVTMLVTAAAILGVMYYLDQRNTPEEVIEEETTIVVEEEEVVDEVVEESDEEFAYISSAVGLNLREKPSTDSEVLIIIPFGTKIPVLAEEGGWIQTEYDNKEGWVSADYTQEDSPWVYENTDYGFMLTFDGGWEGYKVFEETVDGVKVYYIGLPTTESGWVSTGVDSGFSSMFAISAYPEAKWNDVKNSEGPKPTLLKEAGGYAFAWSSAQARPEDLETQFDEIKDIVDTFEI